MSGGSIVTAFMTAERGTFSQGSRRGIDVKRGTMHYTVFHGTSDWNVQRREVVA